MSEIIPIQNGGELAAIMEKAGQAANQAAARAAFGDYASRKAANTLRRQAADLANFAAFLRSAALPAGELQHNPDAWRGITWGIVEAFKHWQLAQGYAVSTVNFRLSTIKVYAKLAAKAGAIDPQELAMIQAVGGYAHKEIQHVDELREAEGLNTRRQTRSNGQRAAKKAAATSITREQAKALRNQPDTPQGRRDAVIMAILLDHGLRCGELAGLLVENIDLKAGTLTFYRQKVGRTQTHKLSAAAGRALAAYLENDQPMQAGPLLLATRRAGKVGEAGGKLAGVGMSNRAITQRVRYLGELAGIRGLSAHDCRHYWATQAARNNTPLDRLQDAGGWSSLAMPGRYIEAAKIANEGVNLGSD